MTLAEFRVLVDAPAKWILNARAVIGPGVRYTLAVAERLALVRHLNLELGLTLSRGWDLAGEVLADTSSGKSEVIRGDGIATLSVDVQRLRAVIAARRSQLANLSPTRRVGRKPKRPSDALAAARAYGVDVTLLEANLQRDVLERIRQLDGMMAFSKEVRRLAR